MNRLFATAMSLAFYFLLWSSVKSCPVGTKLHKLRLDGLDACCKEAFCGPDEEPHPCYNGIDSQCKPCKDGFIRNEPMCSSTSWKCYCVPNEDIEFTPEANAILVLHDSKKITGSPPNASKIAEVPLNYGLLFAYLSFLCLVCVVAVIALVYWHRKLMNNKHEKVVWFK